MNEGTYFVTFNLFDAMPRQFVEKLEAERRVRIAELERLKGKATPAELHAIEQIIRERAEECLDEGAGSCFMNDRRVAEIVSNAITHFDEQRYLLFAWCVMPNHVHVLFEALGPIDKTLHSWKSFTSKESNKILNRDGDFWQQEYFDRTVRGGDDFDRTISYVLNNPVKAGLVNWPWVRSYPERL